MAESVWVEHPDSGRRKLISSRSLDAHTEIGWMVASDEEAPPASHDDDEREG